MEMSLWLSMPWIWSCLKVITCFFCPQARWDAKTNDFFLHPQRWANESITPPHIRIFLRTTRCQSCFMITTRHPWIASVRSPLTPFLRTIDAHHRQATMHDVIACWLRSNEIEAKNKMKTVLSSSQSPEWMGGPRRTDTRDFFYFTRIEMRQHCSECVISGLQKVCLVLKLMFPWLGWAGL